MAASLWDWLRLLRPLNLVLGAAGVCAGALVAFGLDVEWPLLALTAAIVALGMAGGNALNDALDREIDRTAHPMRPVASGAISVAQANTVAGALLVAALAAAWFVNILVALLAAWLTMLLYTYEAVLKRRGFVGNVWISSAVGSLFLVGAAGAHALPQRLEEATGLGAVFVLAALAFSANLAREVYKDIQDSAGDTGHRVTLVHAVGPRRAFLVARLALGLGIAGALAARAWDVFTNDDLVRIAPGLGGFVVALLKPDAALAARWVKIGMLLCLVGFVSIGLK
jgi:geranylgeranylglycerol-phosphate geranylgeranyltransferase